MNGEGRPILLVDDNDSDNMLMERAFQKAGASDSLVIVKDGTEAVAYLQGKGPYADRRKYPDPTAMLLDIKMPKMNGFEVLQWLRNDKVWKGLFVVMQTASARKEDIDRAYAMGVNGFIIKPGSLNELSEIVTTFCSWIRLIQRSNPVDGA